MVETITVVLHTNDLSSMSGSYVKGSSIISSNVITTSYMAGISNGFYTYTQRMYISN